MSGSRSRRRRKRGGGASGKATAARPTVEAARRRIVSPVLTSEPATIDVVRDDPAALRAEIKSLRRALTLAEEKANDADAKRSRAVNRATAALRRDNDSLEAHLTLLVQEIGQIKHLIDRVPRLEADLRARDLQLAERERSWQADRAALNAELDRLRATSHRPAAKALAAVAAAGAGARPGLAR